MSETYIHGIPCIGCSKAFLKAIDSTLDRIRAEAHKDYDRLTGLVEAFVACEMEDECTCGRWERLHSRSEDRTPWGFDVDEVPGRILLNKNLQIDFLTSVIAHELGHAATRFEDKLNRGPMSEEWQSELAADWYAYKWGFGREIARHRKIRNWKHHGVGPGKTFEEFGDGVVYKYRLSRNFVARLIETREAAFTLKWRKVGETVQADVNENESRRVDLAPLRLEKGILAGDCSKDLGFWMYDPIGESEDCHFRVCRVTSTGHCVEHTCPSQYPLRQPKEGHSGSEIVGSTVSIRLKDTRDPFIGEYLILLHRNVVAGEQVGSGSSSVVLTWVSAGTGEVYQEEVFSSKAWFCEEGSLQSASAEILGVEEDNGVKLRLTAPESENSAFTIQTVFPPKEDAR
mgnify:FL=1